MSYCKVAVQKVIKRNGDELYILHGVHDDFIVDSDYHSFSNKHKANYFCRVINNMVDDYNRLEREYNNLQDRNSRQSDTIRELQDKVDDFVDVKARIAGKIGFLECKEKELDYCGSKYATLKKECLEELFRELYDCKE